MKKKAENKIIFWFVAISAIILIGIIILTRILPTYPELNDGSSAFDFCKDKCNGTSGLTTSNNNSKYNFIRCECVTEINKGASLRYPTIMISNYFDSQTYQELNERDVIKRIEESK